MAMGSSAPFGPTTPTTNLPQEVVANRLSLRQQKPNSAPPASHHLLRLQHLQQVATWAAASVPALGAFLGSRLAVTCESLGAPPPPSAQWSCEKCESILQVGVNCSVRIRKKVQKKQRYLKGVPKSINSILYLCHFCSHENVKLGTPKAYVKTKLTQVAAIEKIANLGQALSNCSSDKHEAGPPLSAEDFSNKTLGSSGKKRRRKGWATLKEISASHCGNSPSSLSSTVSGLRASSPVAEQAFPVKTFITASVSFASKQGHKSQVIPESQPLNSSAGKQSDSFFEAKAMLLESRLKDTAMPPGISIEFKNINLVSEDSERNNFTSEPIVENGQSNITGRIEETPEGFIRAEPGQRATTEAKLGTSLSNSSLVEACSTVNNHAKLHTGTGQVEAQDKDLEKFDSQKFENTVEVSLVQDKSCHVAMESHYSSPETLQVSRTADLNQPEIDITAGPTIYAECAAETGATALEPISENLLELSTTKRNCDDYGDFEVEKLPRNPPFELENVSQSDASLAQASVMNSGPTKLHLDLPFRKAGIEVASPIKSKKDVMNGAEVQLISRILNADDDCASCLKMASMGGAMRLQDNSRLSEDKNIKSRYERADTQTLGYSLENADHGISKSSPERVQCCLSFQMRANDHASLQDQDDMNASTMTDKRVFTELVDELKNVIRVLKHELKMNTLHFQVFQTEIQHLSEQMAGLKGAVNQLGMKITTMNEQCSNIVTTSVALPLQKTIPVERFSVEPLLSEPVAEKCPSQSPQRKANAKCPQKGSKVQQSTVLNPNGELCLPDYGYLQKHFEEETILPSKRKMQYEMQLQTFDKLTDQATQKTSEFGNDDSTDLKTNVAHQQGNAWEERKQKEIHRSQGTIDYVPVLQSRKRKSVMPQMDQDSEGINSKRGKEIASTERAKSTKKKMPVLKRFGRRWLAVSKRGETSRSQWSRVV